MAPVLIVVHHADANAIGLAGFDKVRRNVNRIVERIDFATFPQRFDFVFAWLSAIVPIEARIRWDP